jgi:hypothetical protein
LTTWQQNLLETHTLVTLLVGIVAVALILTGDKTNGFYLATVLIGYGLGASVQSVKATISTPQTNQTAKPSNAGLAEPTTENLRDDSPENSW